MRGGVQKLEFESTSKEEKKVFKSEVGKQESGKFPNHLVNTVYEISQNVPFYQLGEQFLIFFRIVFLRDERVQYIPVTPSFRCHWSRWSIQWQKFQCYYRIWHEKCNLYTYCSQSYKHETRFFRFLKNFKYVTWPVQKTTELYGTFDSEKYRKIQISQYGIRGQRGGVRGKFQGLVDVGVGKRVRCWFAFFLFGRNSEGENMTKIHFFAI